MRPSCRQEADLVGDVAREAHLVGRDEHRRALDLEVADDLEHLADALRVERARDLVEQERAGLPGERAGDRDALLPAAGEVVRARALAAGEADARQQVGGARPGRLAPHALGAHRRERDVLDGRDVREEVQRLEDHAEPPPHRDRVAVPGSTGTASRSSSSCRLARDRCDRRGDIATDHSLLDSGEHVAAQLAVGALAVFGVNHPHTRRAPGEVARVGLHRRSGSRVGHGEHDNVAAHAVARARRTAELARERLGLGAAGADEGDLVAARERVRRDAAGHGAGSDDRDRHPMVLRETGTGRAGS
jgi:hypothetical protein